MKKGKGVKSFLHRDAEPFFSKKYRPAGKRSEEDRTHDQNGCTIAAERPRRTAGRAKPEDSYIRFVRKNPKNPSKLQAKTIQLTEIDRCFDELRSGWNVTLSRIVTDLTGFYDSES